MMATVVPQEHGKRLCPLSLAPAEPGTPPCVKMLRLVPAGRDSNQAVLFPPADTGPKTESRGEQLSPAEPPAD